MFTKTIWKLRIIEWKTIFYLSGRSRESRADCRQAVTRNSEIRLCRQILKMLQFLLFIAVLVLRGVKNITAPLGIHNIIIDA